jgi:hypothetical protein
MSTKTRRLALLVAGAVCVAPTAAAAAATPYITSFSRIATLHSAVPPVGAAKGDQNPYGVAVVPRTVGTETQGDVLVSNFNNGANEQGTGSSIVEISPTGAFKLFAVVPPTGSSKAVGLTTALATLPHGFVAVGMLPAPGGKGRAAAAGALDILDSHGHVVKTITGGPINGPWDMTASVRENSATLFVTNVLNGTVAGHGHNVQRGTVVRVSLTVPSAGVPTVLSERVIASGFREHLDAGALVVGPTGVGLGHGGTLFVADSSRNRIAAISQAMTRTTTMSGGGSTVSHGGALDDPLGVTIAPNGDVISANGNNGKLVETSPAGHQVATKTLVPNGAGDLFGLVIVPGNRGLYFVDDAGSGAAANSLDMLFK